MFKESPRCRRKDGRCPAFEIEAYIEERDKAADLIRRNLEENKVLPPLSSSLRRILEQGLREQKDAATQLENKLSSLRRQGELCEICPWLT